MKESFFHFLKVTKLTQIEYTLTYFFFVRNDGRAVVIIDKPGLFTVDINGQMDDQDTGKLPNNRGYYDGPPIHTLTIFANPFISKVTLVFSVEESILKVSFQPSPDDEGVMTVAPGDGAPSEGDWSTLYFLPGVHDIGLSFTLHSNRSYYIPGDALVYGTMNNNDDRSDGDHIKIFGHGTLSGDKLLNPKNVEPQVPEDEWFRYRPIDINSNGWVFVEGITVTNSAFHSVMLKGKYNLEQPTDVRWVKIFTWRGNGDGINPFGKLALLETILNILF